MPTSKTHVIICYSIKLKHHKYQRHRDALVMISQLSKFILYLSRLHYCIDLREYPHHEIISINAPPRVLYIMSQSIGKITRFRITDNKELQRQGSTSDCRVFVLYFIDHTIQENPISKVIQNNTPARRKDIGST